MREHNDPNLSVLGASLLPVLICYSLLYFATTVCVADYHDTMQKYKATSELHLIPLEQQRTYCVGTPGEAGLPADDRFARYANTSYNLKCVRAHDLLSTSTSPLPLPSLYLLPRRLLSL